MMSLNIKVFEIEIIIYFAVYLIFFTIFVLVDFKYFLFKLKKNIDIQF